MRHKFYGVKYDVNHYKWCTLALLNNLSSNTKLQTGVKSYTPAHPGTPLHTSVHLCTPLHTPVHPCNHEFSECMAVYLHLFWTSMSPILLAKGQNRKTRVIYYLFPVISWNKICYKYRKYHQKTTL